MREIPSGISRATNVRENRVDETSRWITEQQALRRQEEGGRRRSNSAPTRLETTSDGYQTAFLQTLQTNLGAHGRQLVGRIERQQGPTNTHNTLDGSTVVNSENTTVHSDHTMHSNSSSIDDGLGEVDACIIL
jgi:hypothetical protein